MSNKPDQGISPTKDDFSAIGQFIATCSLLEICIHGLLKHLLRIEDEIVRMLVGEPRFGDLTKLLKRTAEYKGYTKERMEVLSSLIADIDYIVKVRAIVAHKPVYRLHDSLIFHNTLTAKSSKAIYQYKCTYVAFPRFPGHIR